MNVWPNNQINWKICISNVRKRSSYRELNVKNPASSKLYNYKGHVKFLAHGYTEQGTKGKRTKCCSD